MKKKGQDNIKSHKSVIFPIFGRKQSRPRRRRRPLCEYLSEYTSREKPKIPPADPTESIRIQVRKPERTLPTEWASNSDYLLLLDAKQRGTFHSARWQRDYLARLVLDFNDRRPRPQPVSFRKADWASYTLATERFIPLIHANISVEESDQCSCGATYRKQPAIPFHEASARRIYTPCLVEECQALLKQYEESGDQDIADHLIESLDAARGVVGKN